MAPACVTAILEVSGDKETTEIGTGAPTFRRTVPERS
jgi:hypothetical protein